MKRNAVSAINKYLPSIKRLLPYNKNADYILSLVTYFKCKAVIRVMDTSGQTGICSIKKDNLRLNMAVDIL